MWLSECCDVGPAQGTEVDLSTIPYGGATGFCNHCKDTWGFYYEDPGDPFDTRQEKHGDR